MKSRADYIRAWKKRKDKERRHEQAQAENLAVGVAWSTHPALPVAGETNHEATRRRQGQLRAYREATGQEPWDVPGSWPSNEGGKPATPEAAPPRHQAGEPAVRRLPPGPVYGDRWTARPRWR